MGGGQLRQVTARLAADLRTGQTLPEALRHQGKRVPPFYAGLVEAGVRSGRVADVLGTLTLYARSMADLRATILDATVYPAVVLAASLIILGGLLGFLIPQYDKLFAEFGIRLPLITEAVLYVCRRPGALLVAPVLAVAGAVLLARAVLAGTERGRCWWARAVYALPVVGPLVHAARLAAFTDLLAILVDYGLPLPRAFQLAGESSGDPFLVAGARQARQDLEAGLPLGPALRHRLLLPELVGWMTGVGEQRGELGKTLHHVAEVYRRQVTRRAALLRTVLPPFLIIVTAGAVVGLFVCVLILPMVRYLEALAR
jgi:general secretion pathway protein F